jgi:signal transduction histidine kinase
MPLGQDQPSDPRSPQEILYQVSEAIHATLDSQQALDLIVSEAVRITRAASGSVALINPTNGCLEIQASRGLPSEAQGLRLCVGEGVTGWVAQTGLPARIADVARDPRYVLVRPEVRSELAVPLIVDDHVRGVVNVDADRCEAFDADDQALLEGLARQAARVIQHTWLYEQLRLKARLFEALFRVGQVVNSASSLEEVLQVITREARTLMDARVSSVFLLGRDPDTLELRASHGAGAAYVARPPLSVSDSLLGVVVRRRKPIQIENVQQSTRYHHATMARQEGLVSLLSVPLLYRGEAKGALSVYKDAPHSFSNEEIQILAALGDLSALAIQKAELHERLASVEEQLRQNERLSALGLLAAEVAHEIRNPLTVMKMMYHSLDLAFAPGDPRAKDAKILGEKMDHLNHIVDQILAFARRIEPKLSPTSLNRIVDDLGLLIRHKLAKQGIQLEAQLDPALPAIRADAAQLEQALLNLCLNAVEAMPNGGRLAITTAPGIVGADSLLQEPHVCLSLSDTGSGMDTEQQRKAFGSLLRSSKPGGTGIGLAVVARVIENHHGHLSLESQPGCGTTVRVVLPVAP